MTTRVLVAAIVVCFSIPQMARAQGALARGIWVDKEALKTLPTSGTAWSNLLSNAQRTCGVPKLADQEDQANVCVMAKALVFARTGDATMRLRVVDAIRSIVNSGTYSGRALALGRELGAYAIAADLISLKTYSPTLDSQFRTKIAQLVTTRTTEGPVNLIDCHEKRPNNWGGHCGSSRIAVAAYLGNAAELARAAKVFKGWLGDRASYAGFDYGDLSWQCNPLAPVGINPSGCLIGSAQVGGVLPDDQRRAGGFSWPPPQENYVYEGLQGAMAQAVILKRAGYDAFNWEDKALLRAFKWLQTQAKYLATGDDTWMPHLVNYYYGRGTLPASAGARAGKNVGWTDWTHSGTTSSSGTSGSDPSGSSGSPTTPGSISGTYLSVADSYVRGGASASTNFGRSPDLEAKDSSSSSDEYHRRVFLRFKVARGTVSTATLRMFVNNLANGTPVSICVYGVSIDTWTETGITWRSQPAATASSVACKSVTATGWATWNVTSLVRTASTGDGYVSLMLGDNAQSSKIARFDSREGENPPVLVVN